MNTHDPLPGTLDWYREKGKTDEYIAALVAMIERLELQLTKALEVVATQHDALTPTTATR
jgi:hypothetical protein